MEIEYTKCTCKCCEEKDMEIAMLKDDMYTAMEQTCLRLEAENSKLREVVVHILDLHDNFVEANPDDCCLWKTLGNKCREALK